MNKKSSIVFSSVLLCLISLNLSSQPSDNTKTSTPANHAAGEFDISLSPNMVFSNSLARPAGGFKIQLFVSRRISFDADFVIARNYLHLDPGLIGVPLGLIMMKEEEQTFNEFLISLAGLAMAVEHISYHIPVKSNTDISPYVCLLRFRRTNKTIFTTEGDIKDYFKNNVCFATGVQMDKLLGKFLIAPYVEYSVSYTDRSSFFDCGVYFGYRFMK